MIEELKILHEKANDSLVAIDYWTQGHPLAIGIARLKKYLEKPVNSPFPISLTSNPDVVVVGDNYWPTQLLKLKTMSDGWNEADVDAIKAWNRLNAQNTGDYSGASDLTVVSMVYRIANQFSDTLHNLESAIETDGYGNVEIELSKEWESKLQKDFEHAPDWIQRMKRNYSLFAAFESNDYRLGCWSLDGLQKALEREWLFADKTTTIVESEIAAAIKFHTLHSVNATEPADTKTDTPTKPRKKREANAAARVCALHVKKELTQDPTANRRQLVKDWIESKDGSWEGKSLSLSGIEKMLQENPELWKPEDT